MPCTTIKFPDGTVAIVRHARVRQPKCQFCPRESSKMCDAVVGKTLGGESITCDARCCTDCARQVGSDKDFCPKHAG